MTDEKLAKQIKKNIYGMPQSVKIIFPSGFAEAALAEVQYILNHLWFPQKKSGVATLVENEIFIHDIHMFSIIELLLRSQCLTDIRLIVYQGKVTSKYTFENKCRAIPWEFFVNKHMTLKIKVNSIASKAFHESALKTILANILQGYAADIVSGDKSNEMTTVYADLYKNKLTVSISLAGEPLYKRGYRSILKASAPLREDIAAACIQKTLHYANMINQHFSPTFVLIPFAGTGTFAFEYLQYINQCVSVLYGRKYVLQKMPLFKEEHFKYLFKKALENCLLKNKDETINKSNMICIDPSANMNNVFSKNIKRLQSLLATHGFCLKEPMIYQNDFLTTHFDNLLDFNNMNLESIFIPLNPPYGIRLGKQRDSMRLYKSIANKINELFIMMKHHNKIIVGFILCPNQQTWSVFIKNLQQAKTNTYHINQGGIDIRVCQFAICNEFL